MSGGGDLICVDLDPDEGGVVGQVLEYDHELGPIAVLAPSVQAWLEHLVDKMEAGRMFAWTDGPPGGALLRRLRGAAERDDATARRW